MRDLAGYGRDYPMIRWPDEARIAVSVVVHYEEGAEMTPLEGDPGPESPTEGTVTEGSRRDVHVESMYEYGSRRGVWRLLDILDKHGVKATFFCAGQALERTPAVAREITARGHEPAGHGYRWRPYYDMSRAEIRAEVERAVAAIRATAGQRPVGWNSRVPTAEVREALIAEGGFTYDSDSYSDDLPHYVAVDGRRWLTIPYTLEVTDEKFWAVPLITGYTSPDNFLNVMKANFDRLYEEGATHPKMMSIGLHPRIGGRPSRARQLDLFLRYARGFPRVWFARRADIAAWWGRHYAALG